CLYLIASIIHVVLCWIVFSFVFVMPIMPFCVFFLCYCITPFIFILFVGFSPQPNTLAQSSGRRLRNKIHKWKNKQLKKQERAHRKRRSTHVGKKRASTVKEPLEENPIWKNHKVTQAKPIRRSTLVVLELISKEALEQISRVQTRKMSRIELFPFLLESP